MDKNLPLQEVVIVIIRKDNRFLFQKNQKWQDLSFIGGKIEAEDSSPLEAAYRETGEELAIQREIDYVLKPLDPGIYEEEKLSKRTGKVTLYRFYIYEMLMKKDLSDELNVDENVWLGIEDIRRPKSDSHLSEIVKTIFPILNI